MQVALFVKKPVETITISTGGVLFNLKLSTTDTFSQSQPSRRTKRTLKTRPYKTGALIVIPIFATEQITNAIAE